MSVPLVMFTALGYEISISFLLAPLVAYAFFTLLRTWEAILFSVAAIGGLASIILAEFFYPAGEPLRNILSLSLILISTSFYFLGRAAGARLDLPSMIWCLGIAATVFVVPVALRLFLYGEDFRAFSIDGNFIILNAVYLGLPVFGTFGGNSLANLVALQTIVIAAALFVPGMPRWSAPVLWAGLFFASYLTLASGSRASQIAPFLLVFACVFQLVWFRRKDAGKAIAVVLVVLLSGATAAVFERAQQRTFDMFGVDIALPEIEKTALVERKVGASDDRSRGIAHRDAWADSPPPASFAEGDASNGRMLLWMTAVEELRQSPIFGTGFSGYGRFAADEDRDRTLVDNTSAHNFYITVPWKGGLLFAAPFLAFMAFAAWLVLRNKPWQSSTAIFAFTGLVALFGPMALFWDIPGVPSAGALGWFILGAMGSD